MNIQHTIELEKALLSPETRCSFKQLNLLLADDFVEVGAAGVKFGKDSVLSRLPQEPDTTLFVGRDFSVREIADGVALVTFIVTKTMQEASQDSFRSSLWVWRENRWQMTYHQGTYLAS
ncbi:MAG: DUF4440 domain-containing protein [Alphaproteobacteria bacterium CG_4_10_14_0_8_um_filter_53_9]|nr:MAG: DUF4440 domain-containing protein [Alphaproteobacteria bacterium CG_4_10_14_0_8_um_filter_53_9]